MSIQNAQSVIGLTADGLIGPKTLTGARAVLVSAGISATSWSDQRVVYGAAQAVLAAGGFEPGAVDGFWGHNSQNAFDAWDDARAGRPVNPRPDDQPAPATAAKTQWPLERDMTSFFGAPGDGNPRNTAGRVVFPFAFRLDWATDQSVRQFSCHELVAPAFQFVFTEAPKHYGEARYRQLGLDRFAGCYNPRKKRGGTSWSTHAWGVAVDLYAGSNGLRTKKPNALFSQDVYEPFWRIVESQGLVSLGRRSDFDWMHFQAAVPK